MFTFTRPTTPEIAAFVSASNDCGFSYPHIGATRDNGDPGVEIGQYDLDHNRIDLGLGERCWEAAKTAIREWRMFNFDWVEIHPKNVPIETGQTVAILIRHFGIYSLNSARIVYTLDEPECFGFAYGTLEYHGESGEERFMVERDANGTVWYDLKAFSKPNHVFAKLGYPVVRMLQKRFAHDSKQAMFRAVNSIG